MSKNHRILIPMGIVLVIAITVGVVFQMNPGYINKEKSYENAIKFIKVGQLSEANEVLNNLKGYKNTEILLKYTDALKTSRDFPSTDYLPNNSVYTIPTDYNGDLSREINEYRTQLKQKEADAPLAWEKAKVEVEAKKKEDNLARELAREKSVEEALKAEYEAKALAKTQGVIIGMTKQQVLDSSWGRPLHVNKTTTKYGTHEQWVYGGNNYLYFDDGILTSIQNRD